MLSKDGSLTPALTGLAAASIEWYDFFIYATAAALVFPSVFFAAQLPPFVALIASYSTFAVGLSFMAFAVPATLLSAQAGALGDRFGTRRIIVVAVLATGAFAAIYPFVTSVGWLIGLGLVEGTMTISGLPSLLAEVSRTAEPGHQARTQGVFQTVQTATQIAGSLAGGALFTVSHTAAFLAVTAVCLIGLAAAFVPQSLKLLRLSTERRRAAATHTTPPPGSPGRS